MLGKNTYLFSMLRARRVVRSLKPDIVHAHYATSAGLAARVVNFHPWLVTAHGTDVTLGVQSSLWRGILQRIFSEADCVNPVSHDLGRMVLSLGTPPEKVETFTLGIDTNLFPFKEKPCPAPGQILRLICTRRLEPVYDHATIIKSMATLKKRGAPFRLTLVGEGKTRATLEQLVRDLDLGEQVTFAGAVPNRELPRYLAENDIYLSASVRDGASLCLLEAMAAGLFPIVSRITANAEWIRDGDNGLLPEVGEPEKLAQCILTQARLGERRREILRRNRQLVIERGDRARNMQRLQGIYEALVARRGSNPVAA
jgi:glycosyltransferase involved in cell wall biosynthesis